MLQVTILNSCRDIDFTDYDISILNENEYSIEFDQGLYHSLIPQDIIIILFHLASNMGVNSVYDILKYSIQKLFNSIQNKLSKSEKSTKIEIRYNREVFSCDFSFPLTEVQKNQFIEAALRKLGKE